MDSIQDSSWDTFLVSLQALSIDTDSGDTVENTRYLDTAKNLSRHYFRIARPQLRILAIDSQTLNEFDKQIEHLFISTNNQASPKDIANSSNEILVLAEKISLLREYRLSDISFEEATPRAASISEQEEKIISTIHDLVPSASRSYRQAILDTTDLTRASYRGPANEFREAFREVLDYLAQDSDVIAQSGFKLEEGQANPTRQQKVRYILKARKTPKSAAKIPEDLLDIIDSKIAGITGATYTLANVTAHIETERIEVLRVRRYILLVLSELLAIPE